MLSVKAPVMVVTLLTICLLATNTSAAAGRFGCCRSYIKMKLNFDNIKGYSVQTVTGLCNMNAIIFHTKWKSYCTDPALAWVMDYVNRIRNKAQMVHKKASHAQK